MTWYIVHHKYNDCDDNERDDTVWQFQSKEIADKVIELMKCDSHHFRDELFIEKYEIGNDDMQTKYYTIKNAFEDANGIRKMQPIWSFTSKDAAYEVMEIMHKNSWLKDTFLCVSEEIESEEK